MKNICSITGCLVLGVTATLSPAAAPAAGGPREVVDFDFGWHFAKGKTTGAEQPGFDDSAWREISVPHDWSIEDLEPLPDPGPMIAVTKGTWRFAKGDDMAWKAGELDDSEWAEVRLPAA